ncbi:MAG: TrkA C-terminal domain-containing protein, partial [Sporichthyaceae bacterium]
GIPTVATVSWTADQVLRRLLPAGSEPLWRDPSGSVALCRVHLNPAWTGHAASEIEASAGVRIALLTRLGEGVLPHAETVIQEGDLVHVLMSERASDAAEAVFAAGPPHPGSGAH